MSGVQHQRQILYNAEEFQLIRQVVLVCQFLLKESVIHSEVVLEFHRVIVRELVENDLIRIRKDENICNNCFY